MCVCVLVAVVALSSRTAAQAGRQFASPEEAVKALIETVKAGRVDELLAIFGADGKELFESSDQATARQHRQVFAVVYVSSGVSRTRHPIARRSSSATKSGRFRCRW